MTNTVDIPTPNRCLIDLYSAIVPTLHKVTATCNSIYTDSGSLTQWRFCTRDVSLEHKYMKLARLSQKLSLKSSSLRQHTILLKKSLLLSSPRFSSMTKYFSPGDKTQLSGHSNHSFSESPVDNHSFILKQTTKVLNVPTVSDGRCDIVLRGTVEKLTKRAARCRVQPLRQRTCS